MRVADGSILWSATYDRQQGDLLKPQSDIAGHISQALQAARFPPPAFHGR